MLFPYRLKTTTKKVEYNLIACELKEVDLQLERAEHALNWNSEGIWNYIESLRSEVTDLSQRVAKTQQNVEEVTKIMQQWKEPLYTRTNTGAKENLLDLKGMYISTLLSTSESRTELRYLILRIYSEL